MTESRDGRLGWFAMGGQYDKAVPDGQMVTVLEDVSGAGSRPPAGATLGWHHWTAPSGRTYVKGPMEYPA